MNKEVYFRVQGIPGAQGSKKLTRYGTMIEASQKVPPRRQDDRYAASRNYVAAPTAGPVSVSIEFVFERPKSHFRTGKYSSMLRPDAPLFPTSKQLGDIDKLSRSTLDALSFSSGGSILEDDSQVVSLSADKRYSTCKTDSPGAHISVMPLDRD